MEQLSAGLQLRRVASLSIATGNNHLNGFYIYACFTSPVNVFLAGRACCGLYLIHLYSWTVFILNRRAPLSLATAIYCNRTDQVMPLNARVKRPFTMPYPRLLFVPEIQLIRSYPVAGSNGWQWQSNIWSTEKYAILLRYQDCLNNILHSMETKNASANFTTMEAALIAWESSRIF